VEVRRKEEEQRERERESERESERERYTQRERAEEHFIVPRPAASVGPGHSPQSAACPWA
jgi:hypothetical protein